MEASMFIMFNIHVHVTVHVYVCVHVHVCMGHYPTHSHPSPPLSTHLIYPQGGDPEIS